MSLSKFAFAGILALAAALPNQSPTKRQISLPPLIPAIPGVTEPLSSNAPPLPILQAPTPPLPEVPYTPSNIKPKKVGYFWTGSGDNQHADFLASFSLDDDTFGTLLRLVPVPTSGNEPHHLGRPEHISTSSRFDKLTYSQVDPRMENTFGVVVSCLC